MLKFACLGLPLLLLAAAQVAPDPTVAPIPVGGVILWWGTETSLPAGFEVCDGTMPSTQGATLNERKPDLRDRFAKGARSSSGYRPRSAATGGSNVATLAQTGAHVLAANELPPHTHPIAHQHSLPAHAHSIASHDHLLGTHDHALGDWVRADIAGTAAEVLRRAAPGAAVSGPPPANARTGASGILQTDPGGGGFSGNSTAASSGANATTSQGHTHTISAFDNRPEFLEVLYVIRVK